MYQNDYIIAFDENGKPYIAHSAVGNAVNRVASAVKNARGDRQNHKYILKIDENGRKRYFYTQDEVKAYYEEKRKQAAGVVDKAKEGVKNAVSNAKNAVREATGQAARDRMDAAANNRDTWANARSNANDRLQKASAEKNTARQEKEQAQKEAREADNAIKGLRDKINTDARRTFEDFNKETAAKSRQAQATYDAYRANSANKTNEAVNSQRAAEQAKAEAAQARSDRERADKSMDLSVRAYDTQVAKSRDAHRKADSASRREKEADEDYAKANADRKAAQDRQYEAESAYKENKAAYDKSLAGAVDRTAARARDIASDAKDTASAAYNKAKDSANNTVTNAKNRFERMKSEFRDKAEQAGDAAKSTASKVADKARDIAGYDELERFDKAIKDFNDASTGRTPVTRTELLDRVDASEKAKRDYNKTPLGMVENARHTANSAKSSVQAMIDQARTAAKDASEDLSAKAKSTAQSVKESAQGMIDNARSSTAKAVNEAWDKIPKNADGTVNPFDSNFQSAYNDWKSKKDKYDGSLTGQAKAAAEKATDSVKDMIDKAKKTAKDASQQISDNLDVKQLQKNLERDMKNHGYSLEDAYNQHKDWLETMQSGQLPEEHKEYYKKMSELEDKAYKELKAKQSAKKYFNEYSDNDSDFAEKNYSKENRIEDTDFYSFKRKDGKSVILEEDMKWVLPKGVDAGDPAVKSALKKIANSGNFKSYDDWLENANDILGDAIEKVRDKEK